RHVGIELEGPPPDLEFGLRRDRQRPLQPAFADEAPRADDVGDDVEDHATMSLVGPAGRRPSTGRGRGGHTRQRRDETRMAADTAGNDDVFERDLARRPANYAPLTPTGFLARAASIFPARTAVIHGDRRFTYAEFDVRARRLASALVRRG